MANHASAKKRARTSTRRADINTARVSRVRTFLKKIEMAIQAGNSEAAAAALKAAQPELYRSVSKGLVPKNTAARKMSRLTARIKAMQ